jgi:hypothetical protein
MGERVIAVSRQLLNFLRSLVQSHSNPMRGLCDICMPYKHTNKANRAAAVRVSGSANFTRTRLRRRRVACGRRGDVGVVRRYYSLILVYTGQTGAGVQVRPLSRCWSLGEQQC